jgi:hypothetical protein
LNKKLKALTLIAFWLSVSAQAMEAAESEKSELSVIAIIIEMFSPGGTIQPPP